MIKDGIAVLEEGGGAEYKRLKKYYESEILGEKRKEVKRT